MSPDLARLHVSVERERRKGSEAAEWQRVMAVVRQAEKRRGRGRKVKLRTSSGTAAFQFE